MLVENKTGIRRAELSDLRNLQEMVGDTISSVCRTDYNDNQIWAWISGIDNVDRWNDILMKQYAIVSYDHETITGFCSLAHDHIDLLYVHRDYLGLGLARKLFTEIEQEASQNGHKKLTSDVSITARPFFEHVGFEVINEQKVIRDGVELTNFKMLKKLS